MQHRKAEFKSFAILAPPLTWRRTDQNYKVRISVGSTLIRT